MLLHKCPVYASCTKGLRCWPRPLNFLPSVLGGGDPVSLLPSSEPTSEPGGVVSTRGILLGRVLKYTSPPAFIVLGGLQPAGAQGGYITEATDQA